MPGWNNQESDLRKIFLVSLLALSAAACGGGDGSSTSPSAGYPSVSGNYSGTLTFTYPELGQTVRCGATTSVTQRSNEVSISPLILSGGSCSGLSIPVGDSTITTTGSLGSEQGTYFDSSCGGSYSYTISGGFFGRDFQFSMSASSSRCLNMNITGTLTR